MKKIILGLFFIFASMTIFSEQRLEKIIELETKISRENDRDKAAVLLKEYEKYFEEYLKEIESDEEKIFFLGDQYFKVKKYERAGEIFSRNIDSTRNLFGAATSYRIIGEYEKAIDFYSVLLSQDSNFKEGYLGRGIAYKNLGKYGKAKEDIQIFLSYGAAEEGYLALADIYLAEKDTKSARDILTEGIKQFPKSKEISEMLILTY